MGLSIILIYRALCASSCLRFYWYFWECRRRTCICFSSNIVDYGRAPISTHLTLCGLLSYICSSCKDTTWCSYRRLPENPSPSLDTDILDIVLVSWWNHQSVWLHGRLGSWNLCSSSDAWTVCRSCTCSAEGSFLRYYSWFRTLRQLLLFFQHGSWSRSPIQSLECLSRSSFDHSFFNRWSSLWHVFRFGLSSYLAIPTPGRYQHLSYHFLSIIVSCSFSDLHGLHQHMLSVLCKCLLSRES